MYNKDKHIIEFESKYYYLVRLKDNINSGIFKIDKNHLENE